MTESEEPVYMDETQDTLHAKEASHGPYRDQARFSQLLKGIVHKHKNWNGIPGEQKEAIDVILMKVSRIIAGNHDEPDHYLDISGYAMLCYNLLTTGDHLA